MPFDEGLAARLGEVITRDFAHIGGLEETRMFGGFGYLLNGNMCVGVWKEFLILRVGKEQDEELKQQDFVRDFDITGNAMRGWVMVEPKGFAKDSELEAYLQLAHDFAMTLPPKQK